MARVRTRNQSVECAVVWSIDAGPKPGATCAMKNRDGVTVELRLEPDEFARLWIDLAQDARFKVGGRPSKPDKDLNDAVDDLLRAAGVAGQVS